MVSFPSSAFRQIAYPLTRSLALTLIVGCGGDGLVRHQVSGTVTFKGNKVEYGTMIFEPEASVGTIAPTGFARIENGNYKTDREESPIAGTYRVRVMGFDKSKMKKDAAPGEIIDTPSLFPEYQAQLEIPPPGGRFDIEVPVNRAAGGKK